MEYKSILNDEILWFDGDISLSPSKIYEHILKYGKLSKVYATRLTEDIKKYNKFVSEEEKIKIKETIKEELLNDKSFIIPKEYLDLDIKKYLIDKFIEKETNHSEEEIKNRYNRLMEEYSLFEKNEYLDILKLMVYIIDIFKANNIVWGVGRGSNVSSYILYILEVHDIDSYKYDLPITDFIKEE